MKTIIIMILAVIAAMPATYAQKQPAAVTSAFAATHPHAKNVKWDKEDGKYEASYKENGLDASVVYNADGSVDETETAIAISDLPKKAHDYARAKGKIKEASKITMADGSTRFEAEVNGTDYLFDSAGNFIQEKTDNEDAD